MEISKHRNIEISKYQNQNRHIDISLLKKTDQYIELNILEAAFKLRGKYGYLRIYKYQNSEVSNNQCIDILKPVVSKYR